jgi:hypothetical protein
MSFRPAIFAVAVVFVAPFCERPGLAQTINLPTTMTVERVFPGKHYGDNARILSVQVDKQTVYFVLRDIYTADPEELFMGDDVWRYIKESRPNMIVRSRAGREIAATKPGEIITVQGFFTFASRDLEVSSVSRGSGINEPIKHY